MGTQQDLSYTEDYYGDEGEFIIHKPEDFAALKAKADQFDALKAQVDTYAAELVALAPDVILAHGGSTVGPLLQATRTVPIVFPVLGDPVAAGFVDSLARPGGNVTGVSFLVNLMASKRFELLHQMVPAAAPIAYLVNPSSWTAAESELAEVEDAARAAQIHELIATLPEGYEAGS